MARNITPPLPEITAGGYLIRCFSELGRIGNNGFGPQPLSWAEIEAYAAATEEISTPMEKRELRDMSKGYIRGLTLGKDGLAIAPYMKR